MVVIVKSEWSLLSALITCWIQPDSSSRLVVVLLVGD